MNKIILILLILLSFAAVVVLRMGAIFVMLGLLPSLMAYYLDRDPNLATMKTVLTCNIASMLPILYPMIRAGFMFEPFNTYEVIMDPFNWLIAYAGAALGWSLILLCRIIARFLDALAYEYQIRELERTQKHLLQEWGTELE
ncbi:MAG: hypothetical protein AB7F82_06715, partial [Alphaproteobacteria bacterium]